LHAIRVLKKATSSTIKKFIDEKVVRGIDEEYAREEWRNLYDKESIAKAKQNDLRRKQISKRTIQYWLPDLERHGLVKKNKYNEYSLTHEGRKEIVFSRRYGEIVFRKLVTQPPFKGSDRIKIKECIRRFGIYIFCIFLQNEIQNVKREFYSDDEFLEKFLNWPEETISPRHMFQWFYTLFHSELTNKDIKQIRRILTEEFRMDLLLLNDANMVFERIQNENSV
jgi:DNA-binding PadR family transcriptional regulator